MTPKTKTTPPPDASPKRPRGHPPKLKDAYSSSIYLTASEYKELDDMGCGSRSAAVRELLRLHRPPTRNFNICQHCGQMLTHGHVCP